MEEPGVERRGVEDATHSEFVVIQSDGHWAHALCCEVGQASVDDLGEPIDAFLVEGDGSIGAEPLVLEVDAACPLPATF